MRFPGTLSIGSAFGAALMLMLAGAPPAVATTYTVNTHADTNASNPAVGPHDSGGNISLRSAIEALNTTPGSGDRIDLPKGTYTLTSSGGAGQGTAAELLLNDPNGITIAGAGASSTTIDANFLDRALEVSHSVMAAISGVTVKHGRAGPELAGDTATSCPGTAPTAANPGGAILDGGSLTLTDDTLTGNMAAGNGGAVEDEGGLTVTGSTFTGNNACVVSPFSSFFGFGNGGAIDESSTRDWSIDTSTVSGNFAQGDGGGLSESATSDPTLMVTDSTVSNNHSELEGGGIVGEGSGTIALFADTLAGNTATGDGGGIAGNDEDQVANSTITDNFAGCSQTIAANCTDVGRGEGGGIENSGEPVTISFSTINNNTAEGGNGGNLANGDSATYTLDDSIVTGGVADDSPENCSGFAFTSHGNNLFDDDGTACGATASDLKHANPKLSALANNGGPTETEALQTGSQALDAANDTNCDAETTDRSGKPVDQRHFKRPQGGHCDIGAFEATPDVDVTGSVKPNSILVGQQDTVTWVVGNSGPPGAENTTFTDPGSADFKIDSVHTSQGTCSHTTKSVHCPLGLLAAGGHVTITVVVTGLMPGKVLLHGSAQTSDTDLDPANNHASASFEVTSKTKPQADPAITDAASPDQVRLGQGFSYTLMVSNNGPDKDTQVKATDRLPNGVELQSISSGMAHCTHAGQKVTCALGTMADGSATKIRIDVRGVEVGQQRDAAKVSGAVPDTDSHNNHASATALVVAPSEPAVVVAKLSSACHAESSTFVIRATAVAQAGIRSFVVRVGGRVIGSYKPVSASATRRRLVIKIHGAEYVPGRIYTIVSRVVDRLGRSFNVRRHFVICTPVPRGRGFTG